MKTIYLGKDHINKKPCFATVGFFDGVHRGHRFLIGHLMEDARKEGVASTVVTFDKHPRQVLHSDYQPKLLTTFEEKRALLEATGVDNCVVLPFSEEMAALSARDFMQHVLKEQLGVDTVYIGYDNRFGHNRAEGFDDYAAYGREVGMNVVHEQAFVLNGVNVSSTVVRNYLQQGEVELAEQCLGYPYFLQGKVVAGFQEGRRIGFPTANLQPEEPEKLIPAPGVYAVLAQVEGEPENRQAMMNIGTRPTYGGCDMSMEVHILHFSEEIYRKNLTVRWIHRLRAEKKFPSPTVLSEQLKEDMRMVEEQFERDARR